MKTAKSNKLTKNPFQIDYQCDRCSNLKTNKTLGSFACVCGGTYIHVSTVHSVPVVFDSYYDPSVGKYLSSYREQERVGRAYRTPQHPEGLSLVNDNKKFLAEMRNIRRHRLDYIKAQHAKDTKNDSGHLSKRVAGRTYSFAI